MRFGDSTAAPALACILRITLPLMPLASSGRSGAFVSATSTSPLGSVYTQRGCVRPVAKAEVLAGLLERGVDPSLAERCVEQSRGRPGRAIAFAAQPDLMGDRSRMLERCARVAGESVGERFRYANDLAERFRALEPAGPMILLGLILLGAVTGVRIIQILIFPFVNFFALLFTGGLL